MEMKFNGEFTVDQPREKTYEILSDPEKFAPMLPTYHSMKMKDDKTAVVKVKVGIGKIYGTASTELELAENKPPQYAKYIGKGKVMGGAYNMISSFELEEAGANKTLVKWEGETQIYGKILSLAGGGLRGYAEKEINRLISSLQEALAPGAKPAAAAGTAGPAAEAPAAQPSEGTMKRLFRSLGRYFASLAGDEVVPAGTQHVAAPEAKDKLETKPKLTPVSKEPDGKVIQLNEFRPTTDPIEVEKSADQTWSGLPLSRKEDGRLIRGKGLFVDDYKTGEMLHMVLVRSPYGHAKILGIDTSEADAMPGVICTLTGKEIAEVCQPFLEIGPPPSANIKDYPMAVEKAVYQGEPVVAIIADSPRIAADAAELVDVDYEPLPAVLDAAESLKDENVLHPSAGSNLVWHGVYDYGDVDKVFEEADVVVKIDPLHFHRFASTPLECNAHVVTWDRNNNIDVFTNNSFPSIGCQLLAPALGVSIDQIRAKTHDIGGSFGNKIGNYPYIALAALASKKSGGRPVKWVETRSEHMMAGGHGGERSYYDTEVALDKEGHLLAIRSKHVDDCGAYPRYEPLGAVIWSQVVPSVYKIRNIRIDFNQAVTNKGPCSPNRGYSRLQHMWFMERCIDICAHEMGIDATEMRMKNYITEFPYTTPNGCVYDSGDYPGMLAKAKEAINWDHWVKERDKARAEGRWFGIGIGTTLDSGTNNFGQARIVNPHAPFSGNSEVCTLKLDIDGTVVATLGSVPQGQAHETTTAQVIADELGIGPDMVHVRTGFDTIFNSHTGHSGTYASQFAVSGLSAVHGAATKLKAEIKRLAAHALEANEDDLELSVGEMGPEVKVKGTDKSIPYWGLANIVNTNNAGLPDDVAEITLNVRNVYRPKFDVPDIEKKYGNLTLTYAAQLHIAVIEVDKRTCVPKIHAYACIDDCGNVVNPKVVAGQVHGATAHGLGAALMEQYAYDNDGNLLTSSFTEYTPITMLNMPDLAYDHTVSPSPFSFNGAKGMGEGGGAPLHAVCAALQDALWEEGVIIRDSHNPPQSIFEQVQNPNRSNFVKMEKRSA